MDDVVVRVDRRLSPPAPLWFPLGETSIKNRRVMTHH